MAAKGYTLIQGVLNDMTDGVILVGFDGKIRLINSSAKQILSLPEHDMTNCTIAEIMLETEDNDSFFEAVLNSVSTKKKVEKTIPFIHGDDMVYYRVTTDILANNAERLGVLVQINDITDATMLFIANKRLANQVTDLMNSFVEVMVTAIEEKSSYNANHTKSMVGYARNYLGWLDEQGSLTEHTDSNTAPFLMSIWLHDIGKLLVPQEVMDKPTRLGNALTAVTHRIETARLMLKIRMLEHPEQREDAEKQTKALADAEDLILSANSAGFLDDEKIAQLGELAQIPCLTSDGTTIPLLNDDELTSITIRRGTLTAAERAVIESHVTLTAKLLSKVEFRGDYRSVPEWAAGHHELLDGSGYPDRMAGSSIPWETRLLTIIDVYDALTAEDRPYKPPLAPEKAFSILRDMAENGKIDRDILESFYESRAWLREN
ncbi:MAG: PAS domain-containing protein [Ruminococcus sp.]|nr:PAS domain-containing protein [Ruminococcus sp.]